MRPLELWGGVECTVNRVHGRWFDQMARSGHDRRLDDLDRFADLGIRTLRFPILWERLAPRSLREIDWSWTDACMARLRELGITPIVGLLHHGSGPAYTSLGRGNFAGGLARFARAVAERYPWVEDWTPVNEPLTTARFSGLYGHWYPHRRSDRAFCRILLNELRGTVMAMEEVRKVNPAARLIQTDDIGRTSGTDAVARQVAFENERRWLAWDLLTGRVDRAHALRTYLRRSGVEEADLAYFQEHACPPAVIGLNYYLTSDRYLDHRLEHYPAWSHGGNGRIAYADVEGVRADPNGCSGHECHLRDAWKRYRIPVAFTEVHLGCTREEQIRWLVESWEAAQRARAHGADVRAITAWALLGSFDWHSLVTREEGHYEPGPFDIRAPQPRATALAHVAAQLAAGERPSHPVLGMDGWWRRSDRLTFGPAAQVTRREEQEPGEATGPASCRRATPHHRPAPVLVVGATGTLGRAFHRIARERGLPARLVSRREMDIADPGAVDAMLRTVKPWAVINAAGYVRVDDAERDRAACWRENVHGPVNLAAACHRHAIRLVSFSSDLVFDGERDRPYDEDAPVNPLNVYGASKAEAERRVLEVLPDALMIRTSAFFGPWDEHNFATIALQTLSAGAPFKAPADAIVSPTYVPDLVNAALELLIDGEGGIWHLANDGEMSWFDFARAVAQAAGMTADAVVPCSVEECWSPARRPRYVPLTSRRAHLMRPLADAIARFAAATEALAEERTPRCAS